LRRGWRGISHGATCVGYRLVGAHPSTALASAITDSPRLRLPLLHHSWVSRVDAGFRRRRSKRMGEVFTFRAEVPRDAPLSPRSR
jgi:hypothetical protein